MISMLVRGLAYMLVGVLVWSIGLVTAVTEAGASKAQGNFGWKSYLDVISSSALPALVFLVIFVVSWLRLAAPTRVAGNETKLLGLALMALLALFISHLSGRFQSSDGLAWNLSEPIFANLSWHIGLSLPAIYYLSTALRINRSAAGDLNDGERFEDKLHMSFQYQIFVPSVLFCTTIFSMGVLSAYGSNDAAVPTRALIYLFILAASFALLFRYSFGSTQGVALYLPFIAISLLFTFGAAVLGGFLTSKLIVLAISITLAMGVAEVAKRYGQVKLGKLKDYDPKDADYFLLGSNWASIVFPTLTLVIVTTFGGFAFVFSAILIGFFVISWLHLTPDSKASLVGRSLALSYGISLPILLGLGFSNSNFGGILNFEPLNFVEISDMNVIITLLALAGSQFALMRLAKDTLGLTLTDFLDGMWTPSSYLYRPQCLLLLLAVSSLYLVVLLCLFGASLLLGGASGAIGQVGQNILGAGISVFVISLLGFVFTFLTPGSNDRLKVEKEANEGRARSASSVKMTAMQVLMHFIETGRPGVSWIAGLASAATYCSATGHFNSGAVVIFFLMTGLTMFGFVVNDISDIEKDRAARKTRPIANGDLLPAAASGLAALLLLAILVVSFVLSIDAFVASLVVSAALVFYSLFSRNFPMLKGIYTALLCISPFYVAHTIAASSADPGIILVVFAFVIFRELLLDSYDLKSDREFGLMTFAVLLGKERSEAIGWFGMLVVLFIGVLTVDSWLQSLALIASILSLGVARVTFVRNEIVGLKATRLSMLLGVIAAAT